MRMLGDLQSLIFNGCRKSEFFGAKQVDGRVGDTGGTNQSAATMGSGVKR